LITSATQNKLKISINEIRPELTLINLTGAYLITKAGLVLEVVAQDQLNFNATELDIIKGFGNPNAKYVEERIRADMGIPPDAPEATETPQVAGTSTETAFDFSQIEQAKKIAVLNTIRSELLTKVDDLWSRYSELVSLEEFAALPRVFSYDNTPYTENSSLSLARLEITGEVLNYLNKLDRVVIEKIVWESEYLINFRLNDGKELTFGTSRKASEQIGDLEIVLLYLKQNGKDYSQIDVSSRKAAVTIK
jgi:hypothetical protein